MKNFLLLTSSIVLLQGCATGQYSQTTMIRVLDKRTYTPVEAKTFEVEDKNVLISYVPDIVESGISITVKNKTSQPLKIIWDETTYIGPDNKSLKVFHNGVKIIERANSQTPTLVPPMGVVDDALTPTDNVDWDSNLGNWVFSPLCGTRSIYSHELDDKACLNLTFGYFVTYEIEGKKNSLTFKFKYVSKEPIPKK